MWRMSHPEERNPMKIRKSTDKTNTSSQNSPPVRDVSTRQASTQLLSSYSKWSGHPGACSDDYVLFFSALEAGASVHTACARAGLDRRRLAKWMACEGEPFDELRDSIQRTISASMMDAEALLLKNKPEKWLKMNAKYVDPAHPIYDEDQPRAVESKEETKKVIDYSGHLAEVDKLTQMYINAPKDN